MGVCAFVLGDSGSGKSYSLRNFESDEVGILNVMSKPLPFRKKMQVLNKASYNQVMNALQKNIRRCYVVDDAGYLMQMENFRRIKEPGYAKYAEMALHFEQLIEAATSTNEDTIVYVMMHYDVEANGRMKPRTIGKMLDEKFCIEGASPIVLQAAVQDGRHVFVTTNDGFNAVKCPPEMLPDVMDNDLAAVDDAIREYWHMAPRKGE